MWSGHAVIRYRSQRDMRVWSGADREEQREQRGAVRREINKLGEELHRRSGEGCRRTPLPSLGLGEANERK